MFSEEELLECFKRNVDNKGWIYFVGNPESNAKFIVDDILTNRTKTCSNCVNCKNQYNLNFNKHNMFDDLRFGARFKTRSGVDAIFLFKNGRFLNFVIDKKTLDDLYLEEIVTDLKGFVDNKDNPCDNDIVERIY